MNDFDLESKIKSMRAPHRPDEYWEEFPDRVLVELRRRPASHQALIMPAVFSGARWALTCLMIGFCLWQSGIPKGFSRAIIRDERQIKQSVERFHANLGRLMQDEHGLHHLIEEPS